MAHDPKAATKSPARGKHRIGVYRRFTLLHFAYVLVLTVPAALMLLALDLTLPLTGLLVAEILAFVLVPHVPQVRRAIDARLGARVRAEAATARSLLLLRMSDAHRRDLHALERIAAALRERTNTTDEEEGSDAIGAEKLIDLFVRLAIAHRASCTALEIIGSRPDEELGAIERYATANGRADREWVARRMELLRMRRDARRAAEDEQAAISHDLAMIADTLRWMQESCAAAGNEGLRAELDFAFSGRERDAATLRDLAALRDGEIDTSVLRLGRDPNAPRGPRPQLRVAVSSGGEVEGTRASQSSTLTEEDLVARGWDEEQGRQHAAE